MEVQESGQSQINLVVLLRNVYRQLILKFIILLNKLLDLLRGTPVHFLKHIILGYKFDHLLVPLLAIADGCLSVSLLLKNLLAKVFDLVI